MDFQLKEMDYSYLKELGDELYEKEDYFEATKVFLLITEYFPNEIDAKIRLVTCYFASGLSTLALRLLKEIDDETGQDSQEWLSSMMSGHLYLESEILMSAGCPEAVISRMEELLKTEERSLENIGKLAIAYQHSGRYDDAIKSYNEMLSFNETSEAKLVILPYLISCYKKIGQKEKQKESINEGLKLCETGEKEPDIFYEAAALAYEEGDSKLAQKHLKKYNQSYLEQFENEPETKSKYERQYFSAMLALNIALGNLKEVRTMCADWLDDYENLEVTSRNEFDFSQNIDPSIQYLKDPELMVRYAESTFLRSSMHSIEFAYKGFAARMQGDETKAHQYFLQYKDTYRSNVEQSGEDFDEAWEDMKANPTDMHDFVIPDDDPPLPVLVDEYIERYGK